MGAIYNLLEQHRLESYYNKFHQLGVKDERDFLDGVTDETLNNMGLSQVEKARFSTMKNFIQKLGAPQRQVQAGTPIQKSLESFSIQYTYPKCPSPKHIKADGMPLTDDPFFNTWSLKDRHIENGAMIYTIFTPKENLRGSSERPQQRSDETSGTDVIRCHIMLKGDYELMVDLETDTMVTLRHKLSNTSGVPAHILHLKGKYSSDDTLIKSGISEESTVFFSMSSFPEETPQDETFFINDVVPSVTQTKKGISVLLSSLCPIKDFTLSKKRKLVSYIRELTGCNPLAQSLHQLLCRNEILTRNQKIALFEGLYVLFRELLPQLGSKRGEKFIDDLEVFENSLYCWAHLLDGMNKQTSDHEDFAPISLVSEDGNHFCEPVRVPGVPVVLERADVLQKIKDGAEIPNCTEKPLRETSLQRATDIEKILLSLPRYAITYPLWIHHNVSGQNFQVNADWTFGSMVERLKAFPLLNVIPPLHFKDLGCSPNTLIMLSEDNLGVYLFKDKSAMDTINVRNCLTGKTHTLNVNLLAAMTGDRRDDKTFVTTRIPKEAIMVLLDTSSSMDEKCYGSAEIKKIHAVKELFGNFANRTMAYDFHHVIGLMKFDSSVQTVHTFTENLENFKEKLQNIEASGTTKLYVALQEGACELEKVKMKFPDCRLRIICLTDGHDFGSSTKPVDAAVKLLKLNITVDSVLLGKSENNMLHGISIATGGCCFKPETAKDGLKLFEIETVLSLEQRKPKKKLDSSFISESMLTGLFATHGYDKYPETSLPSQLHGKVTMTESALKKKIQESKDGIFMEKDKRILEELKSLHCDPHPFFGVFPSESDFTFWRIVMQGPPETPYEKGVFELYCQFGTDYPVKPPLLRFVTRVYHCNVNSVGRICHNIFDRNYNAHITMKEIFDAVYGLLIIPEPEDPLDSVLAEEFMTNRTEYEQEAKKQTGEHAGKSLNDVEKKLALPVPQFISQHLLCPLTKKMFVDPVKTKYSTVYERKAIEEHLKQHQYDPVAGPGCELKMEDLHSDRNMKKMVMDHRSQQLQ
ncbi:uncharacterized protein LOC133463424 isoform X2 [Cololabis saira]|uniref:uncharacterized protein LOC133463424 isoform X2 n=1 Tax=Cololabis saira TaxID=129043 RepID=UPI002AD38BB7|nr:uncharacterized protein LOC133463424 isoform X2 [Cololabis saira]